jgi:hypothetical protein
LSVRIRLPPAARTRRVQLLTARSTPRTEFAPGDNGVLIVTVPSVEVHEVVAIDL